MAQFYTLEEAARVLGMSSDELKSKAQAREVRAFLDGGSWRFRVVDVDELARRRGLGSDAELRSPTWRSRPWPGMRAASSISPNSSSASPSPTWAARPCIMARSRRDARRLIRARHPARRPVAASQPDHRLELGDHRRVDLAASTRATRMSGWCPTTSRGPATRTSGWRRPSPISGTTSRAIRTSRSSRTTRPITAC